MQTLVGKVQELNVDEARHLFDDMLLETCLHAPALPSSHYSQPSQAQNTDAATEGPEWVSVCVGQRWQVAVSRQVRQEVMGILFGGSCASYLAGAGTANVDRESSVGVLVLDALLKCPLDVRAQVHPPPLPSQTHMADTRGVRGKRRGFSFGAAATRITFASGAI